MSWFVFFFFNATATTVIYTLSLHDALPIWNRAKRSDGPGRYRPSSLRTRAKRESAPAWKRRRFAFRDRKSTRLNSSHPSISYAVFCLKKKKNNNPTNITWQQYTVDMHV